MFEYSEKVKVKTKYCPECMDENIKVDYEWKELEEKEGWHLVRYMTPVISCQTCGKVSDAPEHKDASYDAASIAMGGLPPMEIKRIRKELGFTSAEKFAAILGVGKATVKRWEARISFPDKNQMRLINILCTVGAEQFAKFSDIQSLFMGSKIKAMNPENEKGKRQNKIINLDSYRKIFSVSAGDVSESGIHKKLELQDAFRKRMVGI